MGYSDAEIAQQLKISRQAVCKTKNKALNNLKLIWVGAEGA
jgi:DNA-directed RNA polymerase specialized sigma subunit